MIQIFLELTKFLRKLSCQRNNKAIMKMSVIACQKFGATKGAQKLNIA